MVDYIGGACSHLFYIAGKINGMGKNGIDRIGGVLLVQFRDSHSLWQFARVPNFQAVFEQHHLHAAVTCIVAVHDGLCKVQYYVKFFKSCIKALLIINKLS